MRRKGIDEAWDALEEMQRQGQFVDRFTVSRMLMKTVGDGRTRWTPAKVYRGIALVEQFIQQQPEEADEVLFNALLDTCCRMKDIGRLESSMKKMRELKIYPSHVTLGILVKAYGQGGDVTRVLKVWNEMAEQRQHANAVTYGCMIDACVKCGHLQKAVEIFQDMKAHKRHRNTILYTMLIKGHGLDKDLAAALALFHEMRDEGVPCNTITYNSIIDVCIKCSDMETAEELFREMTAPASHVQPDLITYSTLLKGYCHIGDLDKALQVAETIKACGLKCDELVYNTLVDGCVKANDLSAGIGLFAEMTQLGMRPSSITHSILIRLYQRNGYKGDAFDAVAQLYQHHGLDRPNAVTERGSKASGGRRDKNRNQHGSSAKQGGGGRNATRGAGSTTAEDAAAAAAAAHSAPAVVGPAGCIGGAAGGGACGGVGCIGDASTRAVAPHQAAQVQQQQQARQHMQNLGPGQLPGGALRSASAMPAGGELDQRLHAPHGSYAAMAQMRCVPGFDSGVSGLMPDLQDATRIPQWQQPGMHGGVLADPRAAIGVLHGSEAPAMNSRPIFATGVALGNDRRHMGSGPHLGLGDTNYWAGEQQAQPPPVAGGPPWQDMPWPGC